MTPEQIHEATAGIMALRPSNPPRVSKQDHARRVLSRKRRLAIEFQNELTQILDGEAAPTTGVCFFNSYNLAKRSTGSGNQTVSKMIHHAYQTPRQ